MEAIGLILLMAIIFIGGYRWSDNLDKYITKYVKEDE